jgi:hypothetical protein
MVEICDEIEPVLRTIHYCGSAPFQTVSLILRFGAKRSLDPQYGQLDRKHGELPVSVEFGMDALRLMSRQQVKREFMIATLRALIDIGLRYGLPHQPLADILAEITPEKGPHDSGCA